MNDCNHASRDWHGNCEECAYDRGEKHERKRVIALIKQAAEQADGCCADWLKTVLKGVRAGK